MRTTLDTVVRTLRGETPPSQFDVQLLRPAAEPVPLNLSILPVALVFEVVLLGFTFGAVMIFQEKQEGVNRAYRVSPGTTLDYIGAKNLLFIAMSLIYGTLLLLVAFGLEADYGRILLLVVLTSSAMTLVGLAIAVFFNNISEWFFVGVGVLIINMLPVFSYSIPTFAPRWLTVIPSYPVLFGAREILFSTGRTGFMSPLVLQLVLFNVVAFVLCYVAVERKLMKAG
jgi:ABC-2 type transport system permease protein/fluoroquinolone transport system permease protein